MASFNDKVDATDNIVVEIVRRTPSGKALPSSLWPCFCLVCSEEMTEWSCREAGDDIFAVTEVTFAHAPEHACRNTQRSMLGQQIADDSPRFPCPKCGKETLEHRGPPGTRICSAAFCRHVIDPK